MTGRRSQEISPLQNRLKKTFTELTFEKFSQFYFRLRPPSTVFKAV